MKVSFDHNFKTNTKEMAIRCSHFHLYYPYIRKYTPNSTWIKSNSNVKDIIDHIKSKMLSLPVFIKSEKKSPKELGFDKCILESPDQVKLRKIISAIKKVTPEFEYYIIREFKKCPVLNPGD